MYSKQPVYYADVGLDRRNHNGDKINTIGLNDAQIASLKAAHAKDLNIDGQIKKCQNQLKSEHVYRIPLRFFTDIGKINFPTKIDYRIKPHMETDMKKLFESRKLLASGSVIPTPDVQIIFVKAPFIQYEQILLDKIFKEYIETMVSIKFLRMGTQKAPL